MANKLNKMKQNKQTKEKEKVKRTCQSWTRIADIKDNVIQLEDNSIIAIVEVLPISLKLLSGKDKDRKIEEFAGLINSIDFNYQIETIKKTVDLDPYLESLKEAHRKATDYTRRSVILENTIKDINNIVQSSSAKEIKYFIVVSQRYNKPENVEKLNMQVDKIMDIFSTAKMYPKRLRNVELEQTLALFFQNSQSSFYKNNRADYDNITFTTKEVD